MCFADFQYYFSRFQICKYKDDYNFESVNIGAENSAKEYELITMTITQAGEQTVSLSQKDLRFYPEDTEIEYS